MKTYFQKGNLNFREKIFSLDFQLIIFILLLGIISFFAMYSTERGIIGYYTISHIYRFFLCFFIFIFFSFFTIHFWYKFSYAFYFLVLILLLGVNFFGITASGSTRWINLYVFNLQPSELMKISLIIFLAKYYNKIPARDVNSIKFMILPALCIFFPVTLVLQQPDLGTALLIAIGGLAVIFLAGFRMKYFIFLSTIMVCITPVIIAFLKPYQKSRILTFLNPERDPLGAGYQIIQSKIAVGSGGIFGKGFLKGSQSYLDYLPEKHTDFIFTLFSEEFGFVGCILLLILYALIIYRIIAIGNLARNNFAKLYCYGFAASFFIYVGVNMSMVLGLLPIVGAPLPILSYGGSSMLSMMIGLGIAMSCRVYSNESLN
jgi:rod shape determining protein RodA